MAEETQTATEVATPSRDFNVIEVTLTFEGYEPMEFKFRRALSKELQEAKATFVGLTETEREKFQPEYRLHTLSALLIEAPKNVPNYEEGEAGFATSFLNHFKRVENAELLDWVFAMYQRKLYPKELT